LNRHCRALANLTPPQCPSNAKASPIESTVFSALISDWHCNELPRNVNRSEAENVNWESREKGRGAITIQNCR
jgi:hypothetical protein